MRTVVEVSRWEVGERTLRREHDTGRGPWRAQRCYCSVCEIPQNKMDDHGQVVPEEAENEELYD